MAVCENTAEDVAETSTGDKKMAQLEQTVDRLATELRSKEIIIDALLEKIKHMEDTATAKRLRLDTQAESARLQTQEMKSPTPVPVEDVKKGDAQQNSTPVPVSSTPMEKQKTAECSEVCKDSLPVQVKQLFSLKSKRTDFKANFAFDKFFDYAGTVYEFALTNKKFAKAKNPLKQYVENNLDGILKYLIENLNELTLNCLCSGLFLINPMVEYRRKLVVFHDVVLELVDFSKLNFIASALFNNFPPADDFYSTTVKEIIYHQLCIDGDIYGKDAEMLKHYGTIHDNMGLQRLKHNIWKLFDHFLVDYSLFDPANKKICEDAIQSGFALRMLCHFADWDFTHNTFIITQLSPLIQKEKHSIHVYYLGLLMMNARRCFGLDRSVMLLTDELRSIMHSNERCSVAAYLVLKQVEQQACDEWIESNREFVEGVLGLDIGYLRDLLVF